MSLPQFNFRVNVSSEAIKESSGGNFISTSGVYPITINFVSIDQTDNGAYRFNMNIDYMGNTQTIYGANIQNNNGSENPIGSRLLNKICKIAGLDTGAQLVLEEETHNVGKDNEAKAFIVATDLSGLQCQIQVKEVFDRYKGEIKRKLDPVNFFSMEGATADELAVRDAGNPVTIGTQLAKILENESTTAYKLGKDENGQPVTDAEVLAFKEAKKSGKPTTGAPRQEAPAAPRKNLFSK